ncbi:bifunctional DNA primase/polymerase [Glaciibacter superstes]|uniref:bifunctional DNA primase/polymerase n=1 Tax=Glaciibacter superstes TaxID=501023 RepID=UPI00047CA81F|nr:bifunctional DNA primase/polymerase [Glaciibacter superstes]
MDTASLLASVTGRSLPDAATLFARAGVPVFPCVPGEKRPLIRHGFHEATSDARQVAASWRRWPAANIGIPTGGVSGLEVVDVDVKASGSGFAGFNRAHREGLVAGWEVLVRTPSGGMHAYYPAHRDRHQPSWQAAGAHVDFRGNGGYIIAPPSVVQVTTELRASYVLITGSNSPGSPVNAPALREFLDPRPNPALLRNWGRLTASVAADPERLAAWITARGEGERNRGLFWASCRLSEAGMSLPEMHDALAPAAEHAGLSPREITATIRSAYRATHTTSATSGGSGRDEIPRRMARSSSQVLS